MIIRRYVTTQILATTVSVATLLITIIAGSRVIKYFYMAAQGRLDVHLLSALLVYQIPAFVELIMPLAFFIGIMLAVGRLYVDNEMTVLSATGISPPQVLRFMMPAMLVVLIVTSAMTLYVTPRSNYQAEELFSQQAARNTFEVLRPGVFQSLENEQVIYVREISQDKLRLFDVFVYGGLGHDKEQRAVIRARDGYLSTNRITGARYLTLEDGTRDQLLPGGKKYQHIRFKDYSILLTEEPPQAVTLLKTMTAPELLRREDSAARAELGWRLSLMLLVPVVAVVGLSLSRVNPRQGRFIKLLPGILLYLSYIVLLISVKQSVEKDHLKLSAFLWVHVIYLAIGWLSLSQRTVSMTYRP